MTPLEDARTLAGNCPSGPFSNLSTYWQTPGNRNLQTVDDYIYSRVSVIVWHRLQNSLSETIR